MPRRSRHRTVLAALAAVTLGVLAVGLRSAAQYDPLAQGNHVISAPDIVRIDGVDDNRDVYRLPFQPGTDHTMTFTVANRGRFAVTIERVLTDRPDSYVGLVAATARRVENGFTIVGPVQLPYRLGPGQQVAFEVTYRLGTCDIAGTLGASLGGLPLRWHAFGFSHSTIVRVPIVAFQAPASIPPRFTAPCPDTAGP